MSCHSQDSWLHVHICAMCVSVGGADVLCNNFPKIKTLDLGGEAP